MTQRPSSNKPIRRTKKKAQPPNRVTNTAKPTSKHSQVRIIGGRYKRQLIPFIDAQGLRPTPDRLRETLFNWIQFELHDAQVLDVCAGSGALGFETLSRGARHVTFIERNPKQSKLIAETALKLKLPQNSITLITDEAVNTLTCWSASLPLHFDIVFIDPPYDLDLWVPIIEMLIEQGLVASTTQLYIEDKKPLSETLAGLSTGYTPIKQTKIGQIYATLIQIEDQSPDCESSYGI